MKCLSIIPLPGCKVTPADEIECYELTSKRETLTQDSKVVYNKPPFHVVLVGDKSNNDSVRETKKSVVRREKELREKRTKARAVRIFKASKPMSWILNRKWAGSVQR